MVSHHLDLAMLLIVGISLTWLFAVAPK